MYSIRILFSVILVSVLFALGCTGPEKEPVTFSISGRIKNPRVGKIILTQEEDINRKKTKFIEEIKPDENGDFAMDFDLEPHIYALDFYGEGKIRLAIDRGQNVVIEVDAEDLENAKITGSEDTAKLREYEKIRKESLNRLVITARNKLKATGDYNSTNAEKAGLEEITSYEEHKAELNEFVEKSIGDSIALYETTLRWDGEKNIPLFESLAKSFEEKHGSIEVTKRIKDKIGLLKKTSVGGTVAAIEISDKDGNKQKMDPSAAKYTLIDFWASWCGPCRREAKTIGALYNKYKSKGFDIYSVSLDDDREKWLEASKTDGRVWTNVSSLQGFETPATFDFAVTALPAKFLIDSEGKIVAKNLHGKELEKKITELLGN